VTLPGIGATIILLLMVGCLIVVPLGVPGVWIMVALAGLLALGGSISFLTWLVLVGIAGIADDKFACCYGRFKSGRQVIECDDVLAGRAELPHDVAADVARAAGDQYLLVSHAFSVS